MRRRREKPTAADEFGETEAAEQAPPTEAPKSELDAVMSELREHKGSSIVRMANDIVPANHIPTGCFILDFALLGGLPEGYTTMLYGLESSGKTVTAKKGVAGFQKKYPGRKAAWIDPEGMFDRDWATKLGVNVNDLVYSSPEHGNEAVDVMAALMDAWEVGLIVLDSIPACVPMKVLDKSAEDDTMGELARLMGKLCSKIVSSHAKERRRGHHVTVILINQFRFKIGGLVLGDPRTLPGGRQINHIPTTKIELKNVESMGKDRHGNEIVEHNEHSFKITKSKHGSSIKNGDFRMIINPDNPMGLPIGTFDNTATVAVFAKRMGLITGGGSSWKIDGISHKFKKLDEIQKFLVENPEDYLSLQQSVLAMQRQEKGLPMIPPDGYLLDWASVD